MEVINHLFGEGRDLNSLQMGCRALVIFFITVVLIKIAGMRTFAKKSPFDNTIVIMLGAILSRAIVGVSPFLPTIIAAAVLALIHRGVAWASLYSDPLSNIMKGKKKSLYKHGEMNWQNMKKSLISESDLMESVRQEANEAGLENVDEIFMERSGQITVVRKS